MNKILFFAQLRERLQCDHLTLDASGQTVEQLKQQLAEQHPHWQEWLLERDVLIALNQTLVPAETMIGQGDEIAMFPPVTGG